MTKMTIRKEKPQDMEAVREVNIQAFGQPQEASIVDKLRKNCDNLVSLVAILENRIVGHILFSPAIIEANNITIEGMGLAPMAVLPEYQRQGIGSAMVRKGIEKLKEKGCPFIIVLGHPGYYPRFGFERTCKYGIRSTWDVPDEAFMIMILDPSAMKGVSGRAKYRPEFDEAM